MILKDNRWLDEITTFLSKKVEETCLSVDSGAIAPLIFQRIDSRQPTLLVVPQLDLAESLVHSLNEWALLLGLDHDVILLPEVAVGSSYTPGGEFDRSGILYDSLKVKSSRIFVASVSALLASAPKPSAMKEMSVTLSVGDEKPLMDVVRHLVDLDYDDEEEVGLPGEFSRRGGLLDVFSPRADTPVRIDYWGDEIESLRIFDPANQRSIKDVDSYTIVPRTGLNVEDLGADFYDYVSGDSLSCIVFSPEQCLEHIKTFESEDVGLRLKQIFSQAKGSDFYELLDDVESSRFEGSNRAQCFSAVSHIVDSLADEVGSGYMQLHQKMISQQVHQWLDTGYSVVLLGKDPESLGFISKWCTEFDIPLDKVVISIGVLSAGIIFPQSDIVVLTERELFTLTTKRKEVGFVQNKKSAQADFDNASFSDLDEGDYVVHLTHGIGCFLGIEERSRPGGVIEEVIVLEYADEVSVYVPVWQVHMISRYIGSGKGIPKLSKIGAKRWSKAKVEAEKSVRDMAADMLRLQAVRSATVDGFRYPDDDSMQNMFDSSFPYNETADQLNAIAEIKADMSREAPMDRLLCGDVGYGKTEVAMRAAFKAVMSGKQVAILVPTTILAQQHFYNFCDRFAEFPVMIDMLSRFRSKKEQNVILKQLAAGTLDIVIGTHRIVQGDVNFSDLGLVIVDEEQRFGVVHKERLKLLRTSVDVLTMTATPIPRTLYMGMTGLRDLSTIVTAPQKRLPVKTVVTKFDDTVITAAIEKELQRGGQVFFLHNRVKTIQSVCEHLRELVPNGRFGIGHGQMHEDELEAVMGRFIEGKIDVLVSTTIIESGLDIPNANTIIIDRADRFGLAELYQLRGRVGRWTRQAFAYLLLPEQDIVTGDARKRIAAIRRYTHLGAGFKLALRDLEIRGAGNLLGGQQSGHINSIGFELYCQLLRSTVARMKGLPDQMPVQVDVALDFLNFVSRPLEGNLGAGFSKEYIGSERLRLEAYRKLSACQSDLEVKKLREELVDRYGALPDEAHVLLLFQKIKIVISAGEYYSLSVVDHKIIIEDGNGIYRVDGKVPTLKKKKPKAMLTELHSFLKKRVDK